MIARACTGCASSRRQRGAVLFVSIIVVLALSLIAITAANTSLVEGRMASDARSMQLAEFAADSALNEARARISDVSAAHGAAHACSYLRCVIRGPTAPAEAAQFMDTPEAISATTPFRVDLAKLSGGDESARLAESPSYVIEDLGKSTPFPKGDSAPGEAPHAFHIIARGVGSTRESTCVVETVYAVAQ